MSEQVESPAVIEFFNAIFDGDVHRIVSMLDSKQVAADVCKRRGHASISALCFAAYRGHAAIVESLLKHGAPIDDVYTNDLSSGTACHFAAVTRSPQRVSIMNMLIARGANLALTDNEGHTALYVAVMERCDQRITLALINAGSPLDHAETLMRAAALSANVARALLARGIDIGALRNERGNTVCHIVASALNPPLSDEKCFELIDLLVKIVGIDIDARDDRGWTAVHMAAERGHGSILRHLLELGASTTLANNDGDSTLHVACTQDSLEDGSSHLCVALLLAAGADVDAPNQFGQTACHVVTLPSLLPCLLAEGANLDARDNRGMTPRQHSVFASMPLADEIEAARCHIACERLEFVRDRALQVCIGLQSLQLSALQTCEILRHSCGPAALGVSFHHWWQIATLVKHFR
jgi:ankyrin repeat protein